MCQYYMDSVNKNCCFYHFVTNYQKITCWKSVKPYACVQEHTCVTYLMLHNCYSFVPV